MLDYDVIIIGAGAAGISAAKNLLYNGKKILLLEGPKWKIYKRWVW